MTRFSSGTVSSAIPFLPSHLVRVQSDQASFSDAQSAASTSSAPEQCQFWLNFEVSSFGEGVIWPTVPYLLTIVSGLAVLRTAPYFAGAPPQKPTSHCISFEPAAVKAIFLAGYSEG